MRIVCFLLAFTSYPYVTASSPHALYLSVIELDHKKLNDQLTIRIKVFADDMADAIKNQFGHPVEYSSPGAWASNSENLKNYFDNHFSCSIDGKSAQLRFVDSELIGDAVWISFQSACPSQWNEITVSATFLMELFPTQSNVVSIFHGMEKRFVNLTKANPSAVIKF